MVYEASQEINSCSGLSAPYLLVCPPGKTTSHVGLDDHCGRPSTAVALAGSKHALGFLNDGGRSGSSEKSGEAAQGQQRRKGLGGRVHFKPHFTALPPEGSVQFSRSVWGGERGLRTWEPPESPPPLSQARSRQKGSFRFINTPGWELGQARKGTNLKGELAL